MKYALPSKDRFLRVLIGALLLMAASAPFFVEAKAVSWSHNFNPAQVFLRASTGCSGYPCTFYTSALQLQNISVHYGVKVLNEKTGTVIPDGGSVPVGTKIVLQFEPFENQDLSWFGDISRGTGFDADSPYGAWQSTLGGVGGGMCAGAVLGEWKGLIYFGDYVVLPPVRSITSLDGLACGGLSGQGEMVCTVTQEKTYTPQFNFAGTNSRFWAQLKQNGACGTANGTYAVPAQSIAYTIKGTEPANRPPTAPVITGPTTGATASAQNFSFRSTDPDNDTIRYGIDWNNDATIDEWLPSSGYVASGTTQNDSYTWTTTGSKTFQARAQDSKGALSPWSSHTITIAAVAPPTVILTANPGSINTGGSSDLEWSSSNATSCAGSGFNTDGRTAGRKSSGTHVVVTPPQTTTYSITCTGPGGNASDTAAVTVAPLPPLPRDDDDSCPAGQLFVEGPDVCVTGACPSGYVQQGNFCIFSACPQGFVRDSGTLLCKQQQECVDTLFCQGNSLYRRDPTTCALMLVQACAPGVCSVNACVGAPAPEVILWEVKPTLGVKGYETTIKWDVVNVSSCSVTGTNGSSWTGFVSGVMGSDGRVGKEDIVNEETTYTLSCVGAGGEATRATTVRLTPIHNED